MLSGCVLREANNLRKDSSLITSTRVEMECGFIL
jgi:hypothetical protein